MKKNIKKLLMILIVVISVFMYEEVNALEFTTLDRYLNEHSTTILDSLRLSHTVYTIYRYDDSFDKAFCAEVSMKLPDRGIIYDVAQEIDSNSKKYWGLLYLINQSSKQDYANYATTQMAIWYYLEQKIKHGNMDNGTILEEDNSNDKVKTLVDNAKKINSQSDLESYFPSSSIYKIIEYSVSDVSKNYQPIFQIDKSSPITQSCESRFNNLSNKKSFESRLSILNDFPTFNNLLNMNIIDGKDACTHSDCPKTSTNNSEGCLYYKYGTSGDLSCSNKYDVNGKKAYCGFIYELNSDYSEKFSNGSYSVKSGQKILSFEDQKSLANGTITAQCYNPSGINLNLGNHMDFIEYMKFSKFEYPSSVYNSQFISNGIDEYGLYEYISTVSYPLPEIYSKIGSGEFSAELCTNCRFLDYGIISKFYDNGIIKIPFVLKVGDNLGNGINSSELCKYNAEPEIVCPSGDCSNSKLNIEFRIIDTKNPFPGKEYNGSDKVTRIVGKNWSVKLNKEFIINNKEAQTLFYKLKNIKEENIDLKYDYTGDGVVNITDLYFAYGVASGECATKEDVLDNSSNNCLIYYIMNKKNNSYNQTNEGSIYKFVLTPDKINKIREYNSKNSYDDIDTMECNDNRCTSTFLKTYF